MSAPEAQDLRAALAAQDVEVATLSDDEHEALWAPERLPADPDAAPLLAAGIRGLVAHGHATWGPDGTVRLDGTAGLVRAARTTNLGHAVLRLPDSERRWFVLEPGVVLEQRRPFPGAWQFTVRDLKVAVREFVDEVVPAGATEGEEWSFGPGEEPDRWTQLTAAHPRTTQCLVLRPVLGSGDWLGQLLTAVTDGSEPGWVALTRWDRHTTVAPARRAAVRRALLELLGGSGLAVPDRPVE